MAFKTANRVYETTTTSGTGPYDLNGAATGYQTFVSGIGDGNTCYYCVTDGTDWEVGLGTVTDAATDTLSRDTISESSNAGAAVDWGTTSKRIFCVFAAGSGGGVDELANTDAPNSYVFYSSDNNCLMWKTASGNLVPIV